MIVYLLQSKHDVKVSLNAIALTVCQEHDAF